MVVSLNTQNVRKKRRELQTAYDATKVLVDTTQADTLAVGEHTTLHSHSAVEMIKSPMAHSKPHTLKSASAVEIASSGKKSVTMAKPPPAMSATGLRSAQVAQRLKENNKISINKVCISCCIYSL